MSPGIEMAVPGGQPETAKTESKNDCENNTTMWDQNQGNKIDQLKNLLPSILSCTALKKESDNSYCGACPKCGGNDRFVYKTDSQRCWCRQCRPETDSMDIIAFQCWKANKTVSELMREYLPKTYTQEKQDVDINAEWQIILDGLNPPHFDALSFKRCEALLKVRGISESTIKALYDDGKIRGTIRHRKTETVACPYTSLTAGQEGGKIPAIQYLTVNQAPFYKMDKNKSFHKGSKAGGFCFFQCGKPIAETAGIVLVEGVLNAITGADVLPDYTWIATGGSELVKKVEAFKTYVKDGTINPDVKFICAFDNDAAGKKAGNDVKKILKTVKNPLLTISWPDDTPNKFDLNDYIRLDKDPARIPEPEKIIDLIKNLQPLSISDPRPLKALILEDMENAACSPTGEQPPDKSKIYLVIGKQPEAITHCENLLHDDGCIYQRGKTLFRITQEEPKPRDGIKPGGSFRLQEITQSWLQNKLNKIATFVEFKEGKNGDIEEVIKNCPRVIPEMILENSGMWPFPYITGVCETPTLRADGSLINKRGYDTRTGLYMAIDNKWQIPENPTREDALKAYDKLFYVIKDFEFTDEESRTTAISAMLTGTVRRLLPSAPAFCFDAPKRGSGKTLLADTIGGIITGEAITTINQGRDEVEFSKRIDSIIFRGDPVINIDNIEYPVSGDTINSILTSELYNPRVLGKSETPKCETNILIMFTGNNVVFKGDMVRRVLISRIDPQCDNPEDRTFDINLREYSREHRRELVTAALTIIRAYHAAGAPRQPVKNYGSFEQWCEFARYPLIWLDKVDPIKSREKVKESDPVTGNLKELLESWYGIYQSKNKTAKEVAEDVRTKFNGKSALSVEQARLKDIVEEIAVDNNGIVNNKRFGNFIAKYRDRFEGGLRFKQSGTFRKACQYQVEKIGDDPQEQDEPIKQDFNFDFNIFPERECSLCGCLGNICPNGTAGEKRHCGSFTPLFN